MPYPWLPVSPCNLVVPVLREFREEAGLTQAAVVARLQRQGWDVSRHVYGFVEDGFRMLSDLDLFAVLKALGKSPSDLEVAFQGFGRKEAHFFGAEKK